MSVQIQEPQQRPGYPAPPVDGANGANGANGAVAAPPAPAPNTHSHTPPAAPASAPVVSDAPAEAPPAARRRRGFLNRRVLLPLLAVVLIVAGLFGFNTYREGQLYVSTDNAQLSGQQVQVGSMNAGRVDAVLVPIGSNVHKGDVVAQVALPSQVGMGQNGQPKMGFLGAGDTRVDVLAPFDGIVIGQPAAVGATVAAGQGIVTMIDPTLMYVVANIDETQITRVKPGQPVSVHVDALNSQIAGKVDVVTPATASSASILPTSNASGNFTKVTQLVPVRITVNLGDHTPLLGANVEVKIRVAN